MGRFLPTEQPTWTETLQCNNGIYDLSKDNKSETGLYL